MLRWCRGGGSREGDPVPGRVCAERELSNEFSAHLSLPGEEFRIQGMTTDEARRSFGSVEQAMDGSRDERSLLC